MFRIFTISIIILLSGCKKATKSDEAPIFVSATPTIETTTTKMGETHTVRGIAEDPDGDTLEYRIISENNVDAKFENEKLKITGIENYFGNASVSYEVSDGDKKANGTITLNIINVDDPPTATNVTLTPLEAFVGDIMTTSNGYYEESVPDTVWILGDITDNNNFTWSNGFQNLNQINLLGKKINETADEMTGGLYNINRTTILIADNNYANAVFDYPNMQAVSNESFPANDPERYRSYFFIRGSETDIGWGGSLYEDEA